MSGSNRGFYEPCWTPIDHGSPHAEPYDVPPDPEPQVRTFETGATRDTEDGKLDYEAFLSPLVLRRYAEYMHAHRRMPDGSLRAGDNWQKGFPLDVLMKSGWRHFMDWWTEHRDMMLAEGKDDVSQMEEAICALLFNGMAYLHELLTDRVSD